MEAMNRLEWCKAKYAVNVKEITSLRPVSCSPSRVYLHCTPLCISAKALNNWLDTCAMLYIIILTCIGRFFPGGAHAGRPTQGRETTSFAATGNSQSASRGRHPP